MRDKKCEMIEYCEIPGQSPWSRNLTKKGKAKTGHKDSQCDLSGFVAIALSKPSNYSFALTSMSFRDFNLFCKM